MFSLLPMPKIFLFNRSTDYGTVPNSERTENLKKKNLNSPQHLSRWMRLRNQVFFFFFEQDQKKQIRKGDE